MVLNYEIKRKIEEHKVLREREREREREFVSEYLGE